MFIFFLILEVLLYFLIVQLFRIDTLKADVRAVESRAASLSYDQETRQVVLYERFVVASFRQCSLNRSLFEYLYSNPGRKISFEELNDNVLKGREVNLSKVADAMGFKCELRKLLFTCDTDSITFHPEKLDKLDAPVKIL